MSLHAKYWPKMFTTLTVLALGLLLLTSQVLVCMGQETETEIDLEKGLVAYWSFDEGEGDIAFDKSGNHNDAGLMRSGEKCFSAKWVEGKIGWALDFDGVDDYGYVEDSPSLNTNDGITMVSWVKTNTAYRYVLCKFAKGLLEYSMVLGANNGLRAEFRATDKSYKTVKGSWNIADGKWHHVVVTYDGSDIRIFIDSLCEKTESWNGELGQFGDVPLSIGRHPGGKMYWNGLIDEVRIYNRAITESEIQKLFQQDEARENIKGQ